MNNLFSGKARALLSLTAAVFSGMILFGCGPAGNGADGNEDNPLTLNNGEAWVEGGIGVIFTDDYKVILVERSSGGEAWYEVARGVYSVSGNTATISGVPGSAGITANGSFEFELLNENILKITRTTPGGGGETHTFTRTSGVDVTLPPSNPGTGGELVLGSGQAWVADEGGVTGVIFKSDGGFSLISNNDAAWEAYVDGTYTTNGGNITMEMFGIDEPMTGTYTVSGSKLMITLDGQTTIYTRTTGINVSTAAVLTGGTLSLNVLSMVGAIRANFS
jgi:hypothetical protein